jgi:transcriptional regulator with XRE-family HTH domain|tara:strand:+ start:20114 stop:20332 length:219 start_codon:yes stop_codon:yes gene_type:complete
MRKPTNGGKIILTIRKARGYNREELASLTGFAVNTIYNWEAGRARPAYDDVETIVNALHFGLEEARRLSGAA